MDNGTGGSEAKSDSGTPNGEGEEEKMREERKKLHSLNPGGQ